MIDKKEREKAVKQLKKIRDEHFIDQKELQAIRKHDYRYPEVEDANEKAKKLLRD